MYVVEQAHRGVDDRRAGTTRVGELGPSRSRLRLPFNKSRRYSVLAIGRNREEALHNATKPRLKAAAAMRVKLLMQSEPATQEATEQDRRARQQRRYWRFRNLGSSVRCKPGRNCTVGPVGITEMDTEISSVVVKHVNYV